MLFADKKVPLRPMQSLRHKQFEAPGNFEGVSFEKLNFAVFPGKVHFLWVQPLHHPIHMNIYKFALAKKELFEKTRTRK